MVFTPNTKFANKRKIINEINIVTKLPNSLIVKVPNSNTNTNSIVNNHE